MRYAFRENFEIVTYSLYINPCFRKDIRPLAYKNIFKLLRVCALFNLKQSEECRGRTPTFNKNVTEDSDLEYTESLCYLSWKIITP